MNVFRSIRGRLQIWYGLILALVLLGFGVTAYQLERGRLFRRVDAELEAAASMLRDPRPGGPFGPRRRPGVERPGPGSGRGPDRDLMRPGWRGFSELFREGSGRGRDELYFVLWRRDGRVLDRSEGAPPGLSRPVVRDPRRIEFRMREGFREATVAVGPGELLLVGRSMAGQLEELGRTRSWLVLLGLTVLGAGILGGWWMTGRALRPIGSISRTAAGIAGGNLSERIRVMETESELGQLAEVLNSTFARLEAAFAQQARFTADAAHELRTPVSVMLMQTQVALNRPRSAEEYVQTVETCQRAAQRMRRLIESLLEMARLDAGQEGMELAVVNMKELVEECLKGLEVMAVEAGVGLETELVEVNFDGDAQRLGLVITNLVSNAIRYSPRGGTVQVRVRASDGMVELEVEDMGIGIAPEHVPHVCERFYKADPSRTGGGGRAGLGLAISKAIVEGHGGVMAVESEMGKGSLFRVRLPVGVPATAEKNCQKPRSPVTERA